MLATGLSAPTQSGVGIAAATASPALSYAIGQEFKKHHAEGTSAHILAHAVLGAAVAAAGGNDALAGALSAGGAEAIAPVVSRFMYGTDDPEKLTAEQKETIASISNLTGVATGATIGNSVTNAVQGGLNAENAVENNQQGINQENFNAIMGGMPSNYTYTPPDHFDAVKNQEQIDKIGKANGQIELGGGVGAGFQINGKVILEVEDNFPSIQVEGGAGVGIGVTAHVLSEDKFKLDTGTGYSISTEHEFFNSPSGTKPKDSSALLGTKMEVEGRVPFVVGTGSIFAGREYPEKGKSAIFKGSEVKGVVKTQIGAGIMAQWDIINFKTKKLGGKPK